MSREKPSLNSAVVIARLLDCEGFTEHTANEVKRYWHRTKLDPRREGRAEKVRRAFSEMARKFSDTDRIVLGRMMAIHARKNFDVGLSMGLTAYAVGCQVQRIDRAAQDLALAESIARDLFTNGAGQRADRIVLTTTDGRDLGGWSFRPAVAVIADALA